MSLGTTALRFGWRAGRARLVTGGGQTTFAVRGWHNEEEKQEATVGCYTSLSLSQVECFLTFLSEH